MRHLNLAHCRIKDRGATALADALEANRQLESLDLSSNMVGFGGARRLGEVLGTPMHKHLRWPVMTVIESGSNLVQFARFRYRSLGIFLANRETF